MTENSQQARVTAMLQPGRIGPIDLKNRTFKAATFENRTLDGKFTPELIEFHRLHAAGGVGMTVVAYCAVAPEGRTQKEQILMVDGVQDGLRRLVETVHAEGTKVGLQLGHAGPVADRKSNGLTPITPMGEFNPRAMKPNHKATEEDLARITQDYRRAARIAKECGVDGLEIHAGHSYLIAAFLSPLLNKRHDRWGGSIENRARLLLEVVKAVREEVGDGMAVWVKLGMREAMTGGLEIEDAIRVAEMLEQQGMIDAIELTAGSSLLNPMYLFHGDAPIKEFVEVFRNDGPAVYMGMKALAPTFLKKYEYKPLYLMELAQQVRARVKLPLILLGGVTDVEGMQRAEAAGFQYVAMGRALLAEPSLIKRLSEDASITSICTHCNLCMPSIYDPGGASCKIQGAEPLPMIDRG